MKYLAIYKGLGIGIYEIEADDEEIAADGARQRYRMDERDGDEILIVPAADVSHFTVHRPEGTVCPK